MDKKFLLSAGGPDGSGSISSVVPGLFGRGVIPVMPTAPDTTMRYHGFNEFFGDIHASFGANFDVNGLISIPRSAFTTIPLPPAVTIDVGLAHFVFTPTSFFLNDYMDMFESGNINTAGVAWLRTILGSSYGIGRYISYPILPIGVSELLVFLWPAASSAYIATMFSQISKGTIDDLIGFNNTLQLAIPPIAPATGPLVLHGAVPNFWGAFPVRGGRNQLGTIFYEASTGGFSGTHRIYSMNLTTGVVTQLLTEGTYLTHAYIAKSGQIYTLLMNSAYSLGTLQKRNAAFTVTSSAAQVSLSGVGYANLTGTIMEDREGNIWVSNMPSGVASNVCAIPGITPQSKTVAGVISRFYKYDPNTLTLLKTITFDNSVTPQAKQGVVILLGFDSRNRPAFMSYRTADNDVAANHLVFLGVRG